MPANSTSSIVPTPQSYLHDEHIVDDIVAHKEKNGKRLYRTKWKTGECSNYYYFSIYLKNNNCNLTCSKFQLLIPLWNYFEVLEKHLLTHNNETILLSSLHSSLFYFYAYFVLVFLILLLQLENSFLQTCVMVLQVETYYCFQMPYMVSISVDITNLTIWLCLFRQISKSGKSLLKFALCSISVIITRM